MLAPQFAHKYSVTKKIILVTNIPTPYRIPLLNETSRQLAARGFMLKVVFAAASYPRRKWQIRWGDCEFPYEILSSGSVASTTGEGTIFFYRGLMRLLFRERATVVIATGFSIGTAKIWLYGLVRGTPYILWSGAVANGYRRVSALRQQLRRIMVKRAKAFIAYGSAAESYLVSLGARRSRCHIAINTVDTAFFRDESVRWRGLHAPPARHELLYIGNLTAGKRLDRLIEAVSVLRRRRSDFVLRLVGDGPERDRLAQLAANLDVADVVCFEGFRQREEIPKYLAAARCFVFPSEYDVWGLVLVEAMAAGLLCISSILAGATVDIIQDGETGFAVDFAEADTVADRMEWVLQNPEDAERIGRNASEFVEREASLGVSALGIVHAVLECGEAANSA